MFDQALSARFLSGDNMVTFAKPLQALGKWRIFSQVQR